MSREIHGDRSGRNRGSAEYFNSPDYAARAATIWSARSCGDAFGAWFYWSQPQAWVDVPEPKSFFTEPKRRNVFRVAIAYVATAWLLAWVADLVFDNFGTPEWVGKTVLFLLALGLPVAILLAWAYELTP